MKLLKGQKGLTFIELLISSFFISFSIVATVNLISGLYKNITLAKLKTYAFNLTSENLEILKTYNFGALALTPDNMIPEPLSRLENDLNPWGNPANLDNIVSAGGANMQVYKWVQNADEDDNGNIVGELQSDLPVSNLKIVNVVVTYLVKGDVRRTSLQTIISNPDTAYGGSTIRGRVWSKLQGCVDCNQCRCDPPGHMSHGGYVYIEGHPEYMGVVDPDTNIYAIYGITPGTYNVMYFSDAYLSGPYEHNPVVVEVSSGDINGINFIAPASDYATISGTIYDPLGVPVNPANYKLDAQSVSADDGLSVPTTVTAAGAYTLTAVSPAALSVSITAVFVNMSGQTFFGQYPSRPSVVGAPALTNINITLQPVITGGAVRIKTLDARDRATSIPNINLNFTNVGSNIVNSYDSGGGGDITAILPNIGLYKLTAAGVNYVPEIPFTQINITSSTPLQKIYLFPAGSISGTITDMVTNLPPQQQIRVLAYSDFKLVSETLSNTITGQYALTGVHTGKNNRVLIKTDGTQYVPVNPSIGVKDAVIVNLGTTTINQDFTVSISYEPVSGTVDMTGVPLTNGVMIVAVPNTPNAYSPHDYNLDSADLDTKAQNTLSRRFEPQYGTLAQRNGTFNLMIPGGFNYDLYAYYTTVSYSISNTAGTLIRYYIMIQDISPNSVQHFTGAWTEGY